MNIMNSNNLKNITMYSTMIHNPHMGVNKCTILNNEEGKQLCGSGLSVMEGKQYGIHVEKS